MDSELHMRQLRYRLKRQGMLELDAWLSPLSEALVCEDQSVLEAISRLFACEPPELVAMMKGDVAVPEILSPWLKVL